MNETDTRAEHIDRTFLERLGQTGRRKFTDQFRHETMTQRLREIYQQVLDDAS